MADAKQIDDGGLSGDRSLRDEFAIGALESLVARDDCSARPEHYDELATTLATLAYKFADAMLKAREAR